MKDRVLAPLVRSPVGRLHPTAISAAGLACSLGAAAAAAHRAPALAVGLWPRGLIEGTETIMFFSAALAFPDAATTIWWIMSAAVAVTALERVRWAAGRLR